MKSVKQDFAIIAAIATLLLATATASIAAPENAVAYMKNQAISQTSACGNEFMPTNIGCQNTDSQIQDDENSVALTVQQTFPVVVQEVPTPPPPPPPEEICGDGIDNDRDGVIDENCPPLPGEREEINVGTSPFNMVYNPDNRNVYVVDNPSNTVYVISSSNNQLIDSVSVNIHPDRVVYDPDNHNLYLLHRFPHLISVISAVTDEVIDTIPLTYVPVDSAYNSDNGYVYVSQQITDNSHFPNRGLISVISGISNEVMDEIVLRLPLEKIVYDSLNNNLFVTHARVDSGSPTPLPSVYVVSVATNQLINDISIAHEHINDIDYNSANGNIYATVSGHTTAGSNDILFVISGLSQEVISSIFIPRNPETTTRNLNEIGIDHPNNYIYVSTGFPDTSYVVSGLSNKIISAIPLSPATPTCLGSHSYAIDNDRNKLFISNPCHGTVTAISTDL